LYPCKNKSQAGFKMKVRTLALNIICTLVIIVFLLSCATTKFYAEPDEASSTILVGQISLLTSEIPYGYEAKDTYTKGIEIHLENMSTGEIKKLYSRGDGYFFMINPEAKSYYLKKLYLHVYETNYRWKFSCTFGHNVKIYIEDGKVNNLGFVRWHVNYKSQQQDVVNYDYDARKAMFKEKFPESEWNNKEWVNKKMF
jgi:hypothetical protein